MKYRAALIGCGHIGSLYANDPKIKGIYTHAGAYIACSKTDLVAVCDLDESKAKACALQWAVERYYTDMELLIEEQRPEIVSICTPDKTHACVVEHFLDVPSIKGIIIEKPLALSLDEAEKIVQKAKDKNISVIVNYNRRYAQGHQQVKKSIENGEIGRVQKVSGYYTKGIFHNGTHWLDLARWFFGEITGVQGFNVTKSSDDDPSLDVWMQFENGATGILQNLDANQYSLFEMDIVGSDGRICITDSGHAIDYFMVCESPFYSGYQTLKKQKTMLDSVSNTLLSVIENMLYSIERNVAPLCSGVDGLKILQIAAAAAFSAKNGYKINIRECNVNSIMHPMC